jgi:hypothetical protein
MSQDAVMAHFLKPEPEEAPEPEAPVEDTPEAPKDSDPTTETEPKKEPEPEAPEEADDEPDDNEQSEEDRPKNDRNVLSQFTDEQQEQLKAWNNAIVEKRLAKTTAQKHAAEEKLEALKAEKEQLATQYRQQYEQLEQNLKAAQPVPSFADNDPLAEITSASDLAKAKKDALGVKHWAEEALDSDDDAIESNGREYSRADVKKILRSARRDLEENLPAREQWIEMKKKFEVSTEEAFPWSTNPTSEENVMLKAEISRSPHFARDPRGRWILALALEQAKVLNQKASTEAKPAEKKPAKAEVPPAPSISTVVPSKKQSLSSGSERMRQARESVTAKNASRDDVYNLMLAQENARAGG